VRRTVGGARLDAGAEIPQHARQIAVPAEREHERDTIADRGTAGGDEGKPAAEADADQADPSVGRKRPIRGDKARGLFDAVGDRGRDRKPREVGDVGGDHGDAARGEVTGQAHQPRLVDS
jgi:hypothetical protein